MTSRWLLVLTTVLILAAGVLGQNATQELKRLEGAWSILRMDINGKAIPEADLKKMTVIFAGDTYTVREGDKQIEKGKQQLDPTKNPKTVDVQIVEGPDKGKEQHGIYELSGDILKMCFAAPGQARPKEFASKAGSKQELGVFQRKK